MTRIKLRYVDRFTDRNNHDRYYFRRGKGPLIALPGLPASAEFIRAYQAALDGNAVPPRTHRARGAPGTFDDLAQRYFQSADYARLAPTTRAVYKLVIERLIRDEKIGQRLVRRMAREHVSRMMAKRADRPAAANETLKKIRILVRFAIANGWRQDDPTLRIKHFTEGEHHTWTE